MGELFTIRTERVTDTVYTVLKNGILDRTFLPGQKLNLPAISEQLGVSRTPIHEALVRLTNEGLVETRPRRGTYVTEISTSKIGETMDVRRSLEILACETAIQCNEQNIEALGQLVQAIATSCDPDEHRELNSSFHEKFVQLSNNRLLFTIYRELHAHVQVARAQAKERWRQRLEQEEKEHVAIVQALRGRYLPPLQHAVAVHLLRAKASLLADLAQDHRNKRR